MPPSQIALPVRPEGATAFSFTATSRKPMEPTEAFDKQTLRDFELGLANEPGRLVLDAHKSSHLRMILDPAYEVSHMDQLGTGKSKDDIRKEHTERWKVKRIFNLNSQGQIERNPDAKGKYGPRIAACIWDASTYIINRHRELHHPGYKKTFESLQQDVYGIRRQDFEYLTDRCAICNNKNPTNIKAPLVPIVASRVMERLQIDLIDMRHIPDGRFKWICHIKDHFSKFTALYATRSI